MSSKENTVEQVGLRTYIDGNGPTIVFVHGWPDDHTLWDKQVAHLKDRFRCVTVDLPGFGPDDRGVEKWGYTMDEVVKRLGRTVEKEGNDKPIILVAHDWGCFFSHKFEAKRPELVRKMVTIDVGGAKHPGVTGTLLMICYQFWLAVAFLLGSPIGDVIARFFAGLFSAPSGARMARASTCYPYYQILKLVLSGREKIKPMYPNCPLMFVYGTTGFKKIMSFHAPHWVENVLKKDGCRVHAMTESSHWVTRDQSDEFNRMLDEFVTDT